VPKPAVNESFLLLFFKKEALSFLLRIDHVSAGVRGRGCRVADDGDDLDDGGRDAAGRGGETAAS
jgi:hypothetical protein